MKRKLEFIDLHTYTNHSHYECRFLFFFAHITQANNIIYDKKNMVRLTNRFVNILFFPEERNVFFPTLISRKLLDKFPFFSLKYLILIFSRRKRKQNKKRKRRKVQDLLLLSFFQIVISLV